MRLPSRWIARLTRLPLAARFRLAGAIVGVAGFGWSAWIFLTVPEALLHEVPLQRLKVQERQLEMIGGKFAVEAAKFSAWFDGLWVGRSLGLTVAVLTIALVLALFWLARIAAIEPVDDERPD